MAEVKQSPKIKQKDDLEILYIKSFPAVARYISRKNGSFEDARDIFHDALVIFIEKRSMPGFILQQTEKAYVLGIAKNLWHCRFRTRMAIKPEAELNKHEFGNYNDEEPIVEKISALLSLAGQKCMKLLNAFYYGKSTMHNIMEQFGFSNERSATVQKFKCLEKLRSFVKQKSLFYEDFFK